MSIETVLRTPTAFFVIITRVLLFLLAHRWMCMLAGLAVARIGGSTGDLLQFALQRKPYVIDAASVVADLLLILTIEDLSDRPDGCM